MASCGAPRDDVGPDACSVCAFIVANHSGDTWSLGRPLPHLRQVQIRGGGLEEAGGQATASQVGVVRASSNYQGLQRKELCCSVIGD